MELLMMRKIDEALNGNYNPQEFYEHAKLCESEPTLEWLDVEDYPISKAMDEGTNQDVQHALCEYVDGNGLMAEVKELINKFTWVEPFNRFSAHTNQL